MFTLLSLNWEATHLLFELRLPEDVFVVSATIDGVEIADIDFLIRFSLLT